jgi:nuclease EXOG
MVNVDILLGSNVLPQDSSMNVRLWSTLESFIRQLVLSDKFKNVYVATGPLFLPKYDEASKKNIVKYEVVSEKNIAIPTHLYKVVLLETLDSKLEIGAFVMPNEPIDSDKTLSDFLVPVSFLEYASGLQLYPKLIKTLTKPEDPLVPLAPYNLAENLCQLNDCNIPRTGPLSHCKSLLGKVTAASNIDQLQTVMIEASQKDCHKEANFKNSYDKKFSELQE